MISVLNNLINNLGYVVVIAFVIFNISGFRKIIQKTEFKKFDLLILSFIFSVFGTFSRFVIFLNTFFRKANHILLSDNL